jgi:hypothetical protein
MLLVEPKDGKEGTLPEVKCSSWLNLSFEQAVALKEKLDSAHKEVIDNSEVKF